MEGRAFTLISVPRAANGSEYARLKKACCQDADLCMAYKFDLPALRMGTLDGLIQLCDDLARIDAQVEGVCKRLVALRHSLGVTRDLNDEQELFTVNNRKFETNFIIHLRFFATNHSVFVTSPTLLTKTI